MLKKSTYAFWLIFAGFASQHSYASRQTDAAIHWPEQCQSVSVGEADQKAERLPALAADSLDARQRQAVSNISSGPRGCIFGPFSIILRSPELLDKTQQMGEYLRFHSVLPKKLRELAILVTGRVYESPYVWYIHEPIALKSGVQPEIVDAIAENRVPKSMDEDERLIYEFTRQLASTHFVSSAVYDGFLKKFNEKSAVELTGLVGYFAILANHLNVARTPLPKGVEIPFGRDFNAKE